MVEVGSAALSSALKVGLNVLVGQKRPVMEIYYKIHNIIGPEYEVDLNGGHSDCASKIIKQRNQDVFIEFYLVNIGAVRAENIRMIMDGRFRRRDESIGFGGVFKAPIAQFSPGQYQAIFRLGTDDLTRYLDGQSSFNCEDDGVFKITIKYNGGSNFINKLTLFLFRFFGKDYRYISVCKFNPVQFDCELPVPEYVG